MAIHSEESKLSNVALQENKWFTKADKDGIDINRFMFMESGKKAETFLFKEDLESMTDLYDTEFIIDEERFVNRPDAISYEKYKNSKYWWLIAMRNGIRDPFNEFYKGRVLKIPNLERVELILGRRKK